MKYIYTQIFVLIFYRILSTSAESCVGLDPGRCCQVRVYKTLCPAICATAVCLRITAQPAASANNVFGKDCGTAPKFTACVKKDDANKLFQQCCEKHVPKACHRLCQYETKKDAAVKLMDGAYKTDGCLLKHTSPLLYCAAENRDNTACCKTLGLGDVGTNGNCLKWCNTSQGNKLPEMSEDDFVCLGNWNVIMYCSLSGLH